MRSSVLYFRALSHRESALASVGDQSVQIGNRASGRSVPANRQPIDRCSEGDNPLPAPALPADRQNE